VVLYSIMDENRPMRFVLLLFLLKYVGKHAKHLARYRKQRKTTKPSMLATKKKHDCIY